MFDYLKRIFNNNNNNNNSNNSNNNESGSENESVNENENENENKNKNDNESNDEQYYEIRQLNNWFKTIDQTKSLEEELKLFKKKEDFLVNICM